MPRLPAKAATSASGTSDRCSSEHQEQHGHRQRHTHRSGQLEHGLISDLRDLNGARVDERRVGDLIKIAVRGERLHRSPTPHGNSSQARDDHHHESPTTRRLRSRALRQEVRTGRRRRTRTWFWFQFHIPDSTATIHHQPTPGWRGCPSPARQAWRPRSFLRSGTHRFLIFAEPKVAWGGSRATTQPPEDPACFVSLPCRGGGSASRCAVTPETPLSPICVFRIRGRSSITNHLVHEPRTVGGKKRRGLRPGARLEGPSPWVHVPPVDVHGGECAESGVFSDGPGLEASPLGGVLS
jgi:hypothetical protein